MLRKDCLKKVNGPEVRDRLINGVKDDLEQMFPNQEATFTILKEELETMKKKKQHGGPRPGSGRKPVTDRKVALTIYVKESVLEALGKETAKEIAVDAITSSFPE